MKTINIYIFTLLLVLCSCTPSVPTVPEEVAKAGNSLEIYPEYQDVTVPCNIAPLNFLVRNEGVEAVMARVDTLTQISYGNKVQWNLEEWRSMLARHAGDTLSVELKACIEGQWLEYQPLTWIVSPDSVDSYVTYRLIEPAYEVWHMIEIEERCIENFETRTLADGKKLGNRCMNCHTHGGDKGQYSYFYIRGNKGGTILSRDGEFTKVTLSNAKTNGGTVYGGWHPSGRYGVFSSNLIIPAFHSNPAMRMEVFDTHSDLCVADFQEKRMITAPSVSQTNATLETFPCFSADGKYIYYSSAPNPFGEKLGEADEFARAVKDLHYSLNRVAFDAETGTIASEVEVVMPSTDSTSYHFAHCSPDGKWLSYAQSYNGTFPIWHMETRIGLRSLDEKQKVQASAESMTEIHASYHTWSHNSRWIVFASKSYDTQYSRVYFVHIAPDGTMSKPLVLPQQDPSHDDMNLKSYNIPDVSIAAVPFDEEQVKHLLENTEAEGYK